MTGPGRLDYACAVLRGVDAQLILTHFTNTYDIVWNFKYLHMKMQIWTFLPVPIIEGSVGGSLTGRQVNQQHSYNMHAHAHTTTDG